MPMTIPTLIIDAISYKVIIVQIKYNTQEYVMPLKRAIYKSNVDLFKKTNGTSI